MTRQHVKRERHKQNTSYLVGESLKLPEGWTYYSKGGISCVHLEGSPSQLLACVSWDAAPISKAHVPRTSEPLEFVACLPRVRGASEGRLPHARALGRCSPRARCLLDIIACLQRFVYDNPFHFVRGMVVLDVMVYAQRDTELFGQIETEQAPRHSAVCGGRCVAMLAHSASRTVCLHWARASLGNGSWTEVEERQLRRRRASDFLYRGRI
ncbi:hypothetical protein NDU88_001600 [Pleurodeles waltl]|uniref:Uncharacterized protein n=1 Tax=Pleurodeles waltl TaxID=8319 RepID=A0AAV7RC24_PLEWA|nr:hypothetical protein NDU88_001600 [Pleurodeles waltl]